MVEFMEALASFLWGPPLLILISVTGVYFTVRSGFFQFSKFGHIISQTFGTLFKKSEKEEEKVL